MTKKLFAPTDANLSLEARGVLGTMINNSECDYCSISDLCNEFENDSKKEVSKAVDELCKLGYLITVRNNTLAVNKQMIPAMQQI